MGEDSNRSIDVRVRSRNEFAPYVNSLLEQSGIRRFAEKEAFCEFLMLLGLVSPELLQGNDEGSVFFVRYHPTEKLTKVVEAAPDCGNDWPRALEEAEMRAITESQ